MNLENFKGSKGTWKTDVHESSNGVLTYTISSNHYSEIGKAPILTMLNANPYSIPKEKIEANAKLISKTPELLESLKSAVNLLKNATEFKVLDSWKEEVRKLEDVVLDAIS